MESVVFTYECAERREMPDQALDFSEQCVHTQLLGIVGGKYHIY